MKTTEQFDSLLDYLCENLKDLEGEDLTIIENTIHALRVIYSRALVENEGLQKLKRCDNCANGPMRRCLYWVDCIRGASIGAIDDKWMGEGAEIDCGTGIEE